VVGGANWIELGAEFAGMVPGGEGKKVWRSRRAKLKEDSLKVYLTARTSPQRLKPGSVDANYGTAEAVS
jgi:hypothetical protein